MVGARFETMKSTPILNPAEHVLTFLSRRMHKLISQQIGIPKDPFTEELLQKK